jgi:hypothetical protein
MKGDLVDVARTTSYTRDTSYLRELWSGNKFWRVKVINPSIITENKNIKNINMFVYRPGFSWIDLLEGKLS